MRPYWIDKAVEIDYTLTDMPIKKTVFDLERYLDIIQRFKIDMVIETGTWIGLSANWFAEHVDNVITIDIEDHKSYVEPRPNVFNIIGSSTSYETYMKLSTILREYPAQHILVSLDSAHNAVHVREELMIYHELAHILVVEDTIHHWRDEFRGDDPKIALDYWMAETGNKKFATLADHGITMHPGGWLRRRHDGI